MREESGQPETLQNVPVCAEIACIKLGNLLRQGGAGGSCGGYSVSLIQTRRLELDERITPPPRTPLHILIGEKRMGELQPAKSSSQDSAAEQRDGL